MNTESKVNVKRFFLIFVLTAGCIVNAAILDAIPSASGSLAEEVMVQSGDRPHIWDWRHDFLTIEAGYTSLQELNSFHSSSYNFGLSRPISGPWILRLGVRKVSTTGTPSSELLGMTPFSQAAQPSRLEFIGGIGFALMDGRGATPFSPYITDVGYALYAIADVQYNYFSSRDPEPISGMRAIYYDYVAEAGLRYQIFLPQSLGLGLEWTYSVPLRNANGDLNSWQRISGILSWSFGR